MARKMARFVSSPEGPSGGGEMEACPAMGKRPAGNVPPFGVGNPRGRAVAAAVTGTKGKAKKKGVVARYGKGKKKKNKPVARY